MLSLSLANDTGASMTDNITSNGQVNVSGVSASSWRYSLDNETSWTNGSGTSFTVTGDGSKSAMVQKWDSTNSVWSASTAPLEFTLDTAAPVFSSGTASGHTISLSFSEAINGNTPPAASDFQVLLDGTGSSVSSLSINGSTIVVTLADDVGNASIHLTYSRTLPNAAVSDVAGNENTSFSMDLYAVQYRANGATSGSAPATQLKNAGDAVTISGNTGSLALTGYSWVGWNTAAGGGGTDYAGGSSYTTDAALTLYAKWQANHYTVAFDAQGGGVTPTSKQVTYHAAYGALPTPTWPGHTFGGWYTQTAGGGDLITAASIVSTAAGHILYATWSLNQYTISFNPNSGSPVMPVKRFYGVALGTLPQSTRTGFTFDSWYYDTNLLNAVNAADTMPSENLTLHAGWTINSYAVTYDENGATGGAPPLSGNYDYDSIVTVSDNTGRMVCPGFSFGGWNTEVDGTGTAYLAGAQFIMPDHAVALYAVWNEIIYPETGDGAHPLLWAALAALALAAGFLLKQSVRKTAHTGR